MKFFKIFTLLMITTLICAADPKARSIGVYVTDVKRQTYSDNIQALGTLKANEHIILSASVSEIIEHIYFEDNQRVKKGDLLVKLDDREELAELAEEQAKLAEALGQLERLEPLAKRGATSKSAIDEAKMEVDTAKARIKAINARISLRHLRAPFDGIVGLRDVSVGTLISAGAEITTIDDDSVMKLDFTVPSIYVASLKKGQKITATSKAFQEQDFEGVVSAISSRIDPVSRSVRVRALIKNENRLLKPGLLMRVDIQANKREKIVIPEGCVISNSTKNSVLVVVKNKKFTTTKKQNITIGGRKRGYVEVLSGLEEGQQIVSDGLVKIKPSDPIHILNASKKGDR